MLLKRTLPVLFLAGTLTLAFANPLDLIGPNKFLPTNPSGIQPRQEDYSRQTLGILPIGGNFKQVASSAGTSTTIYARESVTGWWKSTNYGLTWQSAPQIPLGYLSIDPANPARLFVVDDTARTLSRSTDEGRTWTTPIDNSLQGDDTVKNVSADLQFADAGFVYFRKSTTPNPGIYVSSTSGASWTLRKDPNFPAQSPPYTVGKSPSNGRRIFVFDYRTIRFSDNDGLTWNSQSADLPILYPVFDPGTYYAAFMPQGFAVSLTTPGRLYANVLLYAEYIEGLGMSTIFSYDRVMQSNDYGSTWFMLPGYETTEDLPIGNGSAGNYFFTSAVQTLSGAPRDVLYVGDDRLIQIIPSLNQVNFLDTEDFTNTATLAITPRTVTSIGFNRANASSFFTSTPAGVFRGMWNAAGTGVAWNTYNTRLPFHPVNSVTDSKFVMSKSIGGNFASQAGSGAWYRLPIQFSADMRAIRRPANPNLVFAYENVQVYKSLNSGGSWAYIPPPFNSNSGPFSFVKLQFATNNPDRLYGLAHLNIFPPAAYLLQYENSTNEWTPIAGPTDGSYYKGIIATPGASGRFFVVFQNLNNKAEIAWKRDDDDELHRSVPPMTRVDAMLVDPNNVNRLFLIGGTQQMWADLTNVNAPTYTPVLGNAPAGAVEMLPLGPNSPSAWALMTRDAQGNARVYFTDNAGLSWTNVSAPAGLPDGGGVDLQWDDATAQIILGKQTTGIWSVSVARPGAARLPGSIVPTSLQIASGTPADAASRDGRSVTYTPLNPSLTTFALDNIATSPAAAPAHLRARARLQLEYATMSTTLELYNYQKAKYDILASATGTPAGADLVATPTNPAPYINPSNRQVRARLTIITTGAGPAWQAPVDQFGWEIVP
jgi:hypothetical protein